MSRRFLTGRGLSTPAALLRSIPLLLALAIGANAAVFTQASGSPIGVGTFPFSAAVVDFNRDGKLDFAVANENSNTVTVLLGNGSGGFMAAPGSPFAAGTNP